MFLSMLNIYNLVQLFSITTEECHSLSRSRENFKFYLEIRDSNPIKIGLPLTPNIQLMKFGRVNAENNIIGNSFKLALVDHFSNRVAYYTRYMSSCTLLNSTQLNSTQHQTFCAVVDLEKSSPLI